jgi:hypothetical protein
MVLCSAVVIPGLTRNPGRFKLDSRLRGNDTLKTTITKRVLP